VLFPEPEMRAPAQRLALTDTRVQRLKPKPTGRFSIWDTVLPGLCVRVSGDDKRPIRSFYAVARRLGDITPSWVLLGRYPVLDVAEAREKARKALQSLLLGEHPKAAAIAKLRAAEAAAQKAKADEQASRFATIVAEFDRQRVSKLRASSQRNHRSYLQELVAVFGSRPIGEIKRRDIVKLLTDYQQRAGSADGGTASALGLFSCARALFNWALALEVQGLTASPCAGVKVNKVLGEVEARDRALSDDELRAVWQAMPAAGEPCETVLKLLALLGLRFNEVAGARRSEINFEAATVLVPKERSKTGVAQLVPLPPTAMQLIETMPRFERGDCIFTTTFGQKPVAARSKAKARVDAALVARGVNIPPWRIHDLRRTVRTGLAKLKVPTAIAERVLGHARTKIEKIYDVHSYLDEKRDALERWERHVLGLIEPKPDKVIKLPARTQELKARGSI
jgi:integrase